MNKIMEEIRSKSTNCFTNEREEREYQEQLVGLKATVVLATKLANEEAAEADLSTLLCLKAEKARKRRETIAWPWNKTKTITRKVRLAVLTKYESVKRVFVDDTLDF